METNDPRHRIDWIVCPYCTVSHDGALNVDLEDGAPPVDGDANICGKCAHVSIYDSTVKGGLRLPTPEETETLSQEPEIVRAIQIAKQARWTIQRQKAGAN
jgi:hypothetical protein